jgi:DnaA family protein
MRQMLLDLDSPAVPGLDAFVTGGSAQNEAVLAWLSAWPALEGVLSPAYIWGPPGCGKTLLLRAMIERALALGFGVVWLNAQTCQMWETAHAGAPTLALLDDCDRLGAESQHLAFKLFIEAAAAQAARASEGAADGAEAAADRDPAAGELFILAAGRLPPVDLPVRDDLRTRLGWGLSFAVQPLGEADAREVLLREARSRGVAVADEVLTYLMSRHDRDLGSLMQLLHRLDRYALAEHRPLTIPLLKQMLASESGEAA